MFPCFQNTGNRIQRSTHLYTQTIRRLDDIHEAFDLRFFTGGLLLYKKNPALGAGGSETHIAMEQNKDTPFNVE